MKMAAQIAEFVYETQAIPASTQTMANHVVLDLVTAAVAGYHTLGARIGRLAAQATWGSGKSSCWFSADRLTAAGAAFVNSTMASMLDLDDGHRTAAGHPGAAIIPAVFAEADLANHGGERLMTAIALGYEISVRISAARDLAAVDTLVSGKWCAQGVAAAVGWLRGLSPQSLAEALSIAAACAPNLAAVAYSREMGNHVKEGIPWATAAGISAVDLASAGSTGPRDFLDNKDLYDPDMLLAGLGNSWLLEGVYFKRYSCCRWAHAAIDALLELQDQEGLRVAEIQSITVRTFRRTLQLNNDVAPPNLEAAQYSVPFCMALAAIRGPEALLPLEETWLKDAETINLASKIQLEIDPELDAMFSSAVPAEIEVETPAGRLVRRVLAPKGEPSNPMTGSDLVHKFDMIASRSITPQMAGDIKDSLVAFANFDADALRRILSQPIY